MCEATVTRLHHDLKMIGSLREGDRIGCIDGFLCISRPTIWEAIGRWTRGESRHHSVSCISNALSDAITLVEQAAVRRHSLDCNTRAMVKRFVSELQHALVGLRCLWVTYSNDPSIQARIMVLRESVSDRLAALLERARMLRIVPLDEEAEDRGADLGMDVDNGYSLVSSALVMSTQR